MCITYYSLTNCLTKCLTINKQAYTIINKEGYMKKSDILNWIMRVSNEAKKVRAKEKRVKNETLQKA